MQGPGRTIGPQLITSRLRREGCVGWALFWDSRSWLLEDLQPSAQPTAQGAALVVGGIALLILAGLADRIDLLKIGDVEFHLRAAARQLSQRADELESRGDTAQCHVVQRDHGDGAAIVAACGALRSSYCE